MAVRNASLEDPNVGFVTGLEWMDVPGGAGVPVTEDRVYGLTAWYRAIALIAGVNATLPFKVFAAGTHSTATQGMILDNPNPAITPFEFWQGHYAHALSYGTAYARKVRDRSDRVVELWPVHPSAVTPERVVASPTNPSGKVFKVTKKGSGEPLVLTPREMFETPYLAVNGSQGISPLRVARETLGIALAAEQSAASFYRSGSRLAGVLQSKRDLDEVKATRMKRRWRERTGGSANVGDIAVLDNETEFKPISISPIDAQLLESRRFSATEIARLFGIPPHLLGDVTSSTSWGAGIAEQTDGFVKFTLLPWLELVEQRVDRELLPGGWTQTQWFSKHILEGLLRGTPAQRAAFYHQAITDGWMSRATVREKEDLEYVEGLDEFLVPSNLTLVSVDGSIVPLSAAGTQESADVA